MTEPSLALQIAIRDRLVGEPDLTELVPADAIFDRNARPETMPCIIIGEGQIVFADDYNSFYDRIFATVHVWAQEPSLARAKAIVGVIRLTLPACAWIIDGFTVPNVKITGVRYMRDPDGLHSHAVVSVEAIMRKVSAA